MEPDPLLGKQLGAYLIQNKIGEGGMSRVYKGYHARLRRDVAIKVILSQIVEQAGFRERFEQEIRLSAQLEHPNIVRVYDVGESGNLTYLVMQYVGGGTLRDQLRGGRPLELRRAVHYALQMARALHYAHLRGIVHRDVKPQNMLVSTADTSQLLLSDFGVAKVFDSSREVTAIPLTPGSIVSSQGLTSAGQIVGTAAYMAPEQADMQSVDGRTDVYSLGVVLFQMLTGQVPFQSSSVLDLLYQHVHTVPQSVRELNPTVPEMLARITAKALAKAPAARFQSAEDMAQALETIVSFSSTTTIRTATLGDTQQKAVAHSGGICPNCGIVLDSDSGFCPNCGYYLSEKFTQNEPTLLPIEQPRVQSVSPSQAINNFSTIQGPSVPTKEPKLTKASFTEKCPYCGAETRPGDNFCLNCGNRLLATPSYQQASPIIGDATIPGSDNWSGPIAMSAPPGMPLAPVTDDRTVVETPTIREDTSAPTIQTTLDKIDNPGRFVVSDDKGDVLQEYRLEKYETVIGRAPTSDILLAKDKLTSRRHAVVRYEHGSYVLYDERSATGTFVNGREPEELSPYILKDRDHVSIGEHELIFLALTTSGVEDLPTISIPEQMGEGTIGTRFMLTTENSLDAAPAVPATAPEVQAPVEESVSFTADATAGSLPYSTFALDQTIAQLLEEGENHYKAKRYKYALTVYKRIIRMDPRNIQAHGNKGNVLGRLGQYKEALAAYDAALNIDAKHVSIWNAKGDMLFKLKRYEEALKAYNTALSIKPNDALTLTTKGDVLSRLKRYEEALAACNHALSITSTYIRTWITKGNVLSKQRRYEEALLAYDAALSINPKDASTWTAKGNVLSKLERYEEALKAYTCAADLAPRKPQIWAAKGEVLLQLKRYDEALIAYERAYILNPGDTDISRTYALLRDLKRHKQAQEEEKSAEDQDTDKRKNDNEPAAQDQGTEETSKQGADSTRILEDFDIFISYSGLDAEWVKWVEENLAMPLEDEHDFPVWLPKWMLAPGMFWQREWDRGMEQSRCCAICVGGQTSIDWFKQEVQKARERKQKDPTFRVLAVLLPNVQDIDADAFPELSTWVDFCNLDHTYAFHVLVCGVKGIPPGPPRSPKRKRQAAGQVQTLRSGCVSCKNSGRASSLTIV